MKAMRDYVKFIASLLLFGSNGVVAAFILLPSQDIVFLRTLIGAALLGVIFVARAWRTSGRPPRLTCTTNPRKFAYVLASGISMGLSWLFLYEAYRLVGVGVSSLAYYCAPILVMATSPLIFRERLTLGSVASMAVVLAGALLINGETLEAGGSAWGMACGWLSALAHALMVIFSKKADDVDGLENSLVQLIASFAVAAAFLVATGGLPFAINAPSWPWIITLGLLNTGTGCYLYFSSFRSLSAQTVAVLGYLEPLSAVVCAFVFLGEPMTGLQLLGGGLIIGGAAAGTFATSTSSAPKQVPSDSPSTADAIR